MAATKKSAQTEPTRETGAALRVTAPSGLCLRSGPGFGYPVLAVLPMGTRVCPVETKTVAEGWAAVKTDSLTGWVYARCLAPEADA